MTSPHHASNGQPTRDEPADEVTHRSFLLRSTENWTPTTMTQAKALAQEAAFRADALAKVLSEKAWHDDQLARTEWPQLLELLADLIALTSTTIDESWPDEAELCTHGWTPPREEVRT